MFTFLFNAVRLFAYVSLVLTAVAAGIGRMNPPPPILRRPRPALRLEVEASGMPSAWYGGYGLRDPATGRLEHFAAPGGDRLNHASCSPWRDSDDRSQMVAQWVSYEGRGRCAIPSQSGIARYSIPDGNVLDRVQVESPPISPPCWYPGTEARVVFSAGNGWLYQYNFDEPGGRHGSDGEDQPRPLAWPSRPPGFEQLVLLNPTWPTDPRMRGRLIVSLSRIEGTGKRSRFTLARLWWLQLDPGGTTVVAAGRLTVPRADEDALEERRPQVTTAADGELLLSYLACPPGRSGGQPRLAPIAFDPATKAPMAFLTASDAPAEGGPRSVPRASTDGRQVAHSRGKQVR